MTTVNTRSDRSCLEHMSDITKITSSHRGKPAHCHLSAAVSVTLPKQSPLFIFGQALWQAYLLT
jgi:hypothetical protein